MRLELIPVPTSDIDRAMVFYVETVGFGLDHDVAPAPGVRVVQLTPPGSGCSIVQDMGGVLFSGFEDPDGNTWVLQQLPAR